MNSIDIRVHYRKGASIALLDPLTPAARHFLRDNVGGRTVGRRYVATPKQLLALIKPILKANLSVHWTENN